MLNFSCLLSMIIAINVCNKMQLEMISLCDDRFFYILKWNYSLRLFTCSYKYS